jgi:transcriptional regulator with XRE-family HTH domain
MVAEPDPASVQFGRNLRRLRSLAGLSQAEFGRRLGVSFQQVLLQKHEKGANNASVPTLCCLRAILGCELAELLAGLGGIPAADDGAAAADARRQRIARRRSRAVLAIDDPAVQLGLIRLARSPAGRWRRNQGTAEHKVYYRMLI